MSELVQKRRSLPYVLQQILGRGRATDSTYAVEAGPGIELKYVDEGGTAKLVIYIDKARVAAAEADAKVAQLIATVLTALAGRGHAVV